MNTSTICFTTPQEANIAMPIYLDSIKHLIHKERESDQTVVLHTDQEILAKYASSIVAVVQSKIIGNSSIYPSKMKPLYTMEIHGYKIKVGESGSVIIHPDFRGKGLGKKITTVALQTFAKEYDIIVGATVNNIMFNLRMKQGFERIPFPRELYEEGKKYLAPCMEGGESEFYSRAKCMMYNIKLSTEQKNALIAILTKEYIQG